MKNKANYLVMVYFFSVLASFSFAQNSSSSGILPAQSSSSYNCACHTSKEEAEESFLRLTTECDEGGGENKFVFNKMDDHCYCIDGACNYYVSSSSSSPIESSSSSSKPVLSSSSEEYVYNGTMCSIPDDLYAPISKLSNVHQNLYSSLPYMINVDKIAVSSCSCNENGSFKCTYENFGLGQGYTPSYVSLCDYKEAFWCSGITKGVCDYTGSSEEIYYSDKYNVTSYEWGAMNFSNTEIMNVESGYQPLYVVSSIGTLLFFTLRHVLPKNVTTYDLENAFLKANPKFPSLKKMNEYCRGEWVPHDENCFGTEAESILAVEDSASDCALAAGIDHYSHKFTEEHGWCVVGQCDDGEFYSSATEYSSSSASVLCESHPFSTVPASPQAACFETSGKCYQCNDERGSECANDWLWIYSFNPSNVGWWYKEVDCETGSEKKSDESIGVCQAHPLNKVPSNPQAACFASNDKCYKCNDDRGSECANDWLWIYNFNPSNVGWWYKEVDCYNPNDDEPGRCPEGAILQKSIAEASGGSQVEPVDYTIEFFQSQKYYDALGRNAKYNSKKKQALYKQKYINIIKKESPMQSYVLSFAGKGCYQNTSHEWVCDFNKNTSVLKKDNNEPCGILGKDYGIISKDGYMVGGVTCSRVNIPYTRIANLNKIIGTCKDGSNLLDIKIKVTGIAVLERNETFSVVENYLFPNGHYTTKEDEKAMYYHELGHQKYNTCIKLDDMAEDGSIECVCESKSKAEIEVLAEELRIKTLKPLLKLIDESAELFHNTYGRDGYATKYSCPN